MYNTLYDDIKNEIKDTAKILYCEQQDVKVEQYVPTIAPKEEEYTVIQGISHAKATARGLNDYEPMNRI